MVKIDNKRKLKFYLRDYERGNISQKSAAETLGITSRRFRQIYEIYKSTGSVPIIGLKLGRPMKEVPEGWKEIIKQEYEKYRQNALYQEDTIFARCKIRIPHNKEFSDPAIGHYHFRETYCVKGEQDCMIYLLWRGSEFKSLSGMRTNCAAQLG